MPKPSDDIQDLKRILVRLDRLGGRALACADGVFLIEPGAVRDPRPLVRACVEGRPTSAAVTAALSAGAAPVHVGPALLAAAQRNLKTIEGAPALAALAREVPRIFRRYGELDARWVADKRARLDHLAELSRWAAAGEDGGAWFERVLEVVRLVHGDEAVAAVRHAERRLWEGARARRADARRALAEVLAAIAGGEPPRTPAAGRVAREILAAASRSGRRWRRSR